MAEEECFALKGESAINLFLRNTPRLSVDIDLAYLPVAPGDESLRKIDDAMRRIAARIRHGLRGEEVNETTLHGASADYKLVVSLDGVQIIVEVTTVLRGAVFKSQVTSVSATVEDAYGFAEIQTLWFPDLYSWKVVAALDRQHPRDRFDIHDLLENEGLDDRLREAFLVYLTSHSHTDYARYRIRRRDDRT